ncbi:CRISPR-associated RAMP Csm3 [Brevinematales bacterium NS]|nr:type III-A CRISPR-associated RAMP protein Csm3 [Brevinematales bacterium]QJR22490.1 CRISPR-associated RAMP Csm3 [Brevinematales bacterium NS]
MNLVDYKKLQGKIRIVSGLHIGTSRDNIEIGGMDNPIIRDPYTEEPYIPGSSLKGAMRAIVEWYYKRLDRSGSHCKCGSPTCQACRVFGAGNANNADNALQRGPTRLFVHDARLTEEWRKKFQQGDTLVEEKSENSINRITAEANPRPIERVVPGVEFDFSLSYRIIDTGDGGETDTRYWNEVVLKALAILQQYNYLGGGGSRGNGRIMFVDLKDENGQDVTLPKV